MQNAVLVVVSLVVSALAAEAALSIAGCSYPSFRRADLHTGLALRSGAQGWWREEGESFVRINSAGVRDDREIDVARGKDVIRVATFGDSYAEALQVPVQRTFWRLPGGRLQQCGFASGRRIEVLNFRVSGYSTGQELLSLRHRAAAYLPDLVVLAFLSGNDARDNSRWIAGRYPRPYLQLAGDGTLSVDNAFREHWIFRIKSSRIWALGDQLRLMQLVNKVKNIVGQPLSAAGAQAGRSELGLDDEVYRSQPPPAWERAWRLTEAIVAAMRHESAAIGAGFLLVTLSNPVQVAADPARSRDLAERLGEKDLVYPERRMRAFAEREAVDAVFLAEEFAAHATKTGVHLHGFADTRPDSGHWNEQGHALAAALVARRLCSHPCVPPQAAPGSSAGKAGRPG